MELYIGGFAQGKLEYVLGRYGKELTVIDCGEAGFQEKLMLPQDCVIVNHLHLWVRDLIERGQEPAAVILGFAASHPRCILICDEIGNGIVPLERADRIWREETGRLLVLLAKQAERVERVLCGLGQRIK